MIRVANLSKDFGGNRVLNGINFDLARGEVAYILGPSGAGKSTLLRCLNGLVRPSTGTISVGGMDVERKNLAAVRRRVGFIFQAFHLLNNLSVVRNVLIGRLAVKPPWSFVFTKHDHRVAHAAILAVGLGDKTHVRVSELSGGQKQRVGIARALAHDPEVLLADEPISNLDPVTGSEILALLQSINRERGTTLICVLHDPSLSKVAADRILGLSKGVLVFDRRPDKLSPDDLDRLYGMPRDESGLVDKLFSSSDPARRLQTDIDPANYRPLEVTP